MFWDTGDRNRQYARYLMVLPRHSHNTHKDQVSRREPPGVKFADVSNNSGNVQKRLICSPLDTQMMRTLPDTQT